LWERAEKRELSERFEGKGAGRQRSLYRVQHAVKISIHFVIGETQNVKAVARETPAARHIIGETWGRAVLIAIEFNNQLCIKAKKVCDIRANGLLTAELEAMKAAATHGEPKFALDVGLIASQAPRKIMLHEYPSPAAFLPECGTLSHKGRGKHHPPSFANSASDNS